ncbi:hypothetical protein RFI_27899 [Reticulomyxa filosa]|uniref:Uncharacterized protein n=1 Tax=Reticulomyxa filosa TaxID=46433 RepID=X6M6F1_RETFI|nr:hypothetical protein RFI_27899 [Reticulomyxa filosa]|eukprot:ETO09479.1 hypothetical protein RFI_27899 [Reticulomyxa filosa]
MVTTKKKKEDILPIQRTGSKHYGIYVSQNGDITIAIVTLIEVFILKKKKNQNEIYCTLFLSKLFLKKFHEPSRFFLFYGYKFKKKKKKDDDPFLNGIFVSKIRYHSSGVYVYDSPWHYVGVEKSVNHLQYVQKSADTLQSYLLIGLDRYNDATSDIAKKARGRRGEEEQEQVWSPESVFNPQWWIVNTVGMYTAVGGITAASTPQLQMSPQSQPAVERLYFPPFQRLKEWYDLSSTLDSNVRYRSKLLSKAVMSFLFKGGRRRMTHFITSENTLLNTTATADNGNGNVNVNPSNGAGSNAGVAGRKDSIATSHPFVLCVYPSSFVLPEMEDVAIGSQPTKALWFRLHFVTCFDCRVLTVSHSPQRITPALAQQLSSCNPWRARCRILDLWFDEHNKVIVVVYSFSDPSHTTVVNINALLVNAFNGEVWSSIVLSKMSLPRSDHTSTTTTTLNIQDLICFCKITPCSDQAEQTIPTQRYVEKHETRSKEVDEDMSKDEDGDDDDNGGGNKSNNDNTANDNKEKQKEMNVELEPPSHTLSNIDSNILDVELEEYFEKKKKQKQWNCWKRIYVWNRQEMARKFQILSHKRNPQILIQIRVQRKEIAENKPHAYFVDVIFQSDLQHIESKCHTRIVIRLVPTSRSLEQVHIVTTMNTVLVDLYLEMAHLFLGEEMLWMPSF